jgi:transcriptional regulator with XRE-family HTH domain
MGINGDRLRELRESRGISPGRMADIIGISRQGYLKYETGDTKHPRKLDEIAQFFNVTPDYLLGYDDDKPSYYHDPEVAAIAQEMHDNPEIKVLFHATKGMKKESIEEIRKFVEFQKAKENGFME